MYEYQYGHGNTHTAKKPRYGHGNGNSQDKHLYEVDEEQAGTVTFSLISTSYFTAKVPILEQMAHATCVDLTS